MNARTITILAALLSCPIAAVAAPALPSGEKLACGAHLDVKDRSLTKQYCFTSSVSCHSHVKFFEAATALIKRYGTDCGIGMTPFFQQDWTCELPVPGDVEEFLKIYGPEGTARDLSDPGNIVDDTTSTQFLPTPSWLTCGSCADGSGTLLAHECASMAFLPNAKDPTKFDPILTPDSLTGWAVSANRCDEGRTRTKAPWEQESPFAQDPEIQPGDAPQPRELMYCFDLTSTNFTGRVYCVQPNACFAPGTEPPGEEWIRIPKADDDDAEDPSVDE